MHILAILIRRNQLAFHCCASTTAEFPGLGASVHTPPWYSYQRWIQTLGNTWEGLSKHEPGSLRHRLYLAGSGVLNKLPHEEWFLKSIPTTGANAEESPLLVQCYHTPLTTSEFVREDLAQLVSAKRKTHFWYMVGSVLALPLGILFALVPLPNLPLFYILYRMYCHWLAFKGARHLQRLLATDTIEFKTHPLLDAVFPVDATTTGPDHDQLLSDQQIAMVAAAFPDYGVDRQLKRARSQVLASHTG